MGMSDIERAQELYQLGISQMATAKVMSTKAAGVNYLLSSNAIETVSTDEEATNVEDEAYGVYKEEENGGPAGCVG